MKHGTSKPGANGEPVKTVEDGGKPLAGNPAFAGATEAAAGPQPKSDRLEQKRRLILGSAYKQFREQGYHVTTVDDICEDAGISKGSFYWHYKSKQAVFMDILETWAREVESELSCQFTEALKGPNPFAALTEAILLEAKRERRIMPIWLDFLGEAARAPELRAGLAEFHNRIRSVITELLSPFILPKFGQAALQSVSGVILAGFTGLVWQELVDPKQVDFNTQVHDIMNVLQLLVERADLS